MHKSCCAYLEPLLKSPYAHKLVIEEMIDLIKSKDVKFDAIAFRGLSGALVAPSIAIALEKHLVAVRKEAQNHSGLTLEGYVGCPYIIIDDQIDTGSTIRSIVEVIGTEPEAIFLWNHWSRGDWYGAPVYKLDE